MNNFAKQSKPAWQTSSNLGWLWMVLILALAACSPAAPVPAPAAPATVLGSLQINISGLPAGVPANVDVKGPENFSLTLIKTTTLPNLKSGTYTFTLNAVKPDSATFSNNGSPASLNFQASVGGSVNLIYGCSSVKAPDAALDGLLQAATGKPSYNCADLAQLRSLAPSPNQPGKTTNLEGLQYATGLTSLSLIGNRVSTFPTGVFDKMPNLSVLDLDDNRMTSLPAGVFDKLTNLKTLTLRNNLFSTFPTNFFDKLTNLTLLSLRNNRFSNLPAGVFDKLTNLTTLDLIGNQISALPSGVFNNLTNLTTLLLADNLITTLPTGVFGKLPNGATVNLVNTCLATNQNPVKASLEGLTRLNMETFPILNSACPQKSITLVSIQAKKLTTNNAGTSENIARTVTIDGVAQNFGLELLRRASAGDVINFNQDFFVLSNLTIDVQMQGDISGSAVTPDINIGTVSFAVNASDAPGLKTFTLTGGGSEYVVTLNLK